MLQEDADIHVITQTKIRNEIHCTVRVNTHEIGLKIDTGAKYVLPLYLFQENAEEGNDQGKSSQPGCIRR